jgi:hypothetical protein
MKLYVRDLALRSRFDGVDVPDLIVVDLADERSVEAFERDRPPGRAIGFYPHVRRDLAERARQLGIEPVEKRILFEDVARALQA